MICKVIRARYPDQPSWELSKGGLFGTSCLSGQFYFPVLHLSICRFLKKRLYVQSTAWEGDSVILWHCRKFWPGGRGWALSSQLPTIYPHLLCRRCLLKQTWTLLVLQGWHKAQNYNTLKKERGKAHFLSTTWQSGKKGIAHLYFLLRQDRVVRNWFFKSLITGSVIAFGSVWGSIGSAAQYCCTTQRSRLFCAESPSLANSGFQLVATMFNSARLNSFFWLARCARGEWGVLGSDY